ncbi:MAG TPA: hypothetical protein VJ770_05040 [Stellaceae bacterium]|nr:hypothetical protein [Stellaceae bacterium]
MITGGNEIADEDLAHIWLLQHARITPNRTCLLNWLRDEPAMPSAL